MPKIKTNSAVKKRFKVKPSGKVKRYRACRNHLKTRPKQTPDSKRRLRHPTYVGQEDAGSIKALFSGKN
jgi:large subunit ribosomal protein L35